MLELRLDDQGMVLSGQIGPAQLQPWLDALSSRMPALGPAWLMEIGPLTPPTHREDEPDELSRFVVRFAQPLTRLPEVRP